MYRYIVKRLLLAVPTLVGAAALVFILMRLIPGDVCVIRMGAGGGARRIFIHEHIGFDRLMLPHQPELVSAAEWNEHAPDSAGRRPEFRLVHGHTPPA